MSRRKKKSGWKFPQEDLVRTVCKLAGEVTRDNGRTYRLFECPHPHCNLKNGTNIIQQQKGTGFTGAAGHLNQCVGRETKDDLNQLFARIQKNPDKKDEILTEFKEEAAHQKPKPKPSRPNRKRPYGVLNENEMKDARTSVEHILMTGSKNQHDVWRRQQFRKSHQEMLEKEHDQSLDAPPLNPFGPAEHPDNNIFAEDVRIYGHRVAISSSVAAKNLERAPMEPWPSRPKKRGAKVDKPCINDKEWDIEHGDTINPLAFSAARLSQVPPTEQDLEVVDGKNRLIETTEVGLTDDQAPRALILRCWERAVHAASCVAHAPKAPPEPPTDEQKQSPPDNVPQNATSTNAPKPPVDEMKQSPLGNVPQNTASANTPRSQSLYDLEQELVGSSRKAVRAKCISLGFKLGGLPHEMNCCPICAVHFDDNAQLKRHFYGGREDFSIDGKKGENMPATNPNENATPSRGCCWKLINEKQLSLIKSSLERHFEIQAKMLLGTVMRKAREKLPSHRSNKKLRLMNWHDIFKFMESAYGSSVALPNAEEGKEQGDDVLKGLKIDSTVNPMLLNPAILEVVRRRLIDRYADVPR
eukprot:scaffold1384_cov116-Cylindrotheca_fusiformis.AAC.26